MVVLEKMCDIFKNGSRLTKINHTFKRESHLKKWLTLETWVTLRKMCHTL